MARLAGKAGAVVVATVTTAGMKSWTIDQAVDALEGTGFDSGGFKMFTPGLVGFSGSFEAFKDGAPLTIGSEVALEFKESTATTQKFTGQGVITGLAPKTDVAGLVTYSYTFQGTGTTGLTIATG